MDMVDPGSPSRAIVDGMAHLSKASKVTMKKPGKAGECRAGEFSGAKALSCHY